jgi:hypothetical protein
VSTFIIFKKTSSHVGNKDQDDGMPPHHGVHSRAIRSMVSHKTAGVSLTNKEEQLFTTPFEDKDNQGGT